MGSKICRVVIAVVTGTAVLTAVTLVAAQTVPAPSSYRPVGTAQELELAGYAKILCSAVFVSGRDPAEATKNSGGNDKVAWHVNREQKLVRMTLGGVTREARFYGDQGCIIQRPDKPGIFFKPVLKAGKDFVGGAVARSEALSTAGDVQKSTSELSQSIGAGAPAKVEESVKKVADVTADLLDKSANVPDSDAKKSLETKSAEAVEALSTAAPHSPEATVDGLTKIGLRAEATGQHRIQSQVVSSLQQIERTNPNTEAGRLARESLKRLGRKLF